jgi:hypothetical protein
MLLFIVLLFVCCNVRVAVTVILSQTLRLPLHVSWYTPHGTGIFVLLLIIIFLFLFVDYVLQCVFFDTHRGGLVLDNLKLANFMFDTRSYLFLFFFFN